MLALATPFLRERIAFSPEAAAIQAQLRARAPDDPVAQFYRERDYRPLWIAHDALLPAATQVTPILRGAAADGLDPARFAPGAVAHDVAVAASRRPADLARAEIALSDGVSRYAVALHVPPPSARLAFVDPAIPMPPTNRLRALEAIAREPSLRNALVDIRRMNPIYDRLRAALARSGGPATALIRQNLDRARALPADLGQRYILVNPAAQTLWLFDHGHPDLQMKVVVGKTTEQTPSMIGLIRYAVLAPYWNVPPDLTRTGIAPKVLAEGARYLAAHHLQALSDWSANATPLDPATVDWSAVASGAQTLRVRQLPGPDNMMGQLKFMLPNPLGVYLHDTPNKALFVGDQRTDSAGCVRLANAEALGAAIFGHALAAAPGKGPEQPIRLPTPLPVYILYLTAQPGPDGLTFPPDVYRRDAPAGSANRSSRG